MKKRKSHQKWSWIVIVTFFALEVVDTIFGLLGIICMLMPLYHALKGRGRVHCSHYCPRGSFFGRFLEKISLENTLPEWMRKKRFKHILLGLMLTMFSISMYHTGGNINKVAFGILRFLFLSSILGIVLGIFFKPRSWCQVCPMGHASYLVSKGVNSAKNRSI